MNFDQPFVDKLATRLAEQEAQMSAAGGGSRARFVELVKEHSALKKSLEKANHLLRLKRQADEHRALIAAAATDPELKALAQEELPGLEQALAAAERDLLISLLPPNPNDSRNTIIEIRAGAGGAEASLFAGDLLRMYTKFAENRGWKTEMIDASPSDQGGYKETIFSIQGENVYRMLQFEGGTHRVQRVPATEAQGRIHTSTATVAVLPEAEEIDDIEIKPEDLRIDVYRASGAGGQHVNKTDSAVRITHLPTNIVVASQEERSQHKNRAKAMRVLRSRLLAGIRRQNETQMGDDRRSQVGGGDRSERIRTYNFPQNRLTDHRINFSQHNLARVMEGELDQLLNALYDCDVNLRIEKTGSLADSRRALSAAGQG